MRTLQTLLLLSVIISMGLLVCSGGPPEGIVAEVGDEAIKVEEIADMAAKRRFNTSQDEYDFLKRNIDRLVEDKIYKLAALDSNLDEDSTVKQQLEGNSERFLLQAMFNSEIANKVEVIESELKGYYDESCKEVRASHILVKDDEQADNIYKELTEDGTDFAELAKKYSEDPGTKTKGGDLGFFEKGRMIKEFSDKAFSMEKGEISEPVKTQYGWQDDENFLNGYKRMKEMEVAQKFMDNMIEDANINFNDEGAGILLNAFAEAKEQPSQMGPGGSPMGGGLSLDIPDDAFMKVLFNYKYGAWTIKDFMDIFNTIPPAHQTQVTSVDELKELLGLLLQRDLLAEKAKELKIEDSEEYQEQYNEALESIMVTTFKREYLTNIGDPTEEELMEYYNAHSEEFMDNARVHIREIETETEAEAKALLDQVQGGADFAELAKEQTLRSHAKPKGGELNFPERVYPKLFEATKGLQEGDLAGPIKNKEGKYSIIKFIDRTEEKKRDLDKVKNRIKIKLSREKAENFKKEWLEKAKAAYDVTIYDDAIKAVIDESKYSDATTAGGDTT